MFCARSCELKGRIIFLFLFISILFLSTVPCPVLFLHVPAIGSFSHWVFDAPNEQFFFSLF